MATRNFVPRSGSEGQIGTVEKPWGKVVANTLMGSISGSATSTGSFGFLSVAGNITASGTIRADAFESVTGGEEISFKDSLHITGNITASLNISASGDVIGTNYRSFYVAAAGMTPSVTNGAAAATVERPGNAGTGNTYHSLDYLAFDGGTNEFANFQMTIIGCIM